MKKMFFIITLLLAAVTASAQGEWQTITTEADELKGTHGGDVCIYEIKGTGSFVVWDWNDPQIRITSDNGIFNMKGGWLKTLVGIYNGSGKMKEKFELWLGEEDGSGYRYARTINKGMIPPGQKKKVKKIFDALLSGEGFVRIIAPIYDKADFDMKIIPYQK